MRNASYMWNYQHSEEQIEEHQVQRQKDRHRHSAKKRKPYECKKYRKWNKSGEYEKSPSSDFEHHFIAEIPNKWIGKGLD